NGCWSWSSALSLREDHDRMVTGISSSCQAKVWLWCTAMGTAQPTTRTKVREATRPVDRRARRRQETIEEILRIANDVMVEDGVNALSIAEIARRLGVQPPSIYKYYDSLLNIYDALFERGQTEHLELMRHAMASAEPGLPAFTAGLDASGRWCLANR